MVASKSVAVFAQGDASDAVMARTLYTSFGIPLAYDLTRCFYVTQRLRHEVGHGHGDTASGSSTAKCPMFGDPCPPSMSTATDEPR